MNFNARLEKALTLLETQHPGTIEAAFDEYLDQYNNMDRVYAHILSDLDQHFTPQLEHWKQTAAHWKPPTSDYVRNSQVDTTDPMDHQLARLVHHIRHDTDNYTEWTTDIIDLLRNHTTHNTTPQEANIYFHNKLKAITAVTSGAKDDYQHYITHRLNTNHPGTETYNNYAQSAAKLFKQLLTILQELTNRIAHLYKLGRTQQPKRRRNHPTPN